MRWYIFSALEGLFTLLSFSCMRLDKRRAIRHAWRIPEKVLLFLTLLGPIGTLGAMCLRLKGGRHKSQKLAFWLMTIYSLLLHAAICALLLIYE